MMTGFLAEENLTGRAQKNVRIILDVIPENLREDAVIAPHSVPKATALLQKRRIFRNYRAQTGAGSGHILPKKPCRT